MNIPGSNTSGEKLRYQWSEKPPAPKQARVYVISSAVQRVKNSAVTQASNIARSQEKAAKEAYRSVYPNTVADNATVPVAVHFGLGSGYTEKLPVNNNSTESPNGSSAKNPETVKTTLIPAENADYLADAYINIEKARLAIEAGEKNVG